MPKNYFKQVVTMLHVVFVILCLLSFGVNFGTFVMILSIIVAMPVPSVEKFLMKWTGGKKERRTAMAGLLMLIGLYYTQQMFL